MHRLSDNGVPACTHFHDYPLLQLFQIWFYFLVCVLRFDLPTLAYAQTLSLLLVWLISNLFALTLTWSTVSCAARLASTSGYLPPISPAIMMSYMCCSLALASTWTIICDFTMRAKGQKTQAILGSRVSKTCRCICHYAQLGSWLQSSQAQCSQETLPFFLCQWHSPSSAWHPPSKMSVYQRNLGSVQRAL